MESPETYSMLHKIRWRQRYDNFGKALMQLREAVQQNSYSKLEMQGVIQCFEYTIELAWKTLQDLIHAKGFPEVSGPRPVIRKAFVEGYITDDEGWLNMWDDRLTTSHTYDEAAANEIVGHIKESYFAILDTLHERLAGKHIHFSACKL